MFSDIAEKVRLEAKLRGFSEHTVKTYVRNVELFFESVQKRPEKVKVDDIKRYLVGLMDKGLDNRTVCKVRAALRFYFDEILQKGLVGQVKAPKFNAKLPENVLTKDEARKPFSAAHDLRETMLLHMLYTQGLRAQECVSLEIKNLDLTAGRIEVRHGKGAKSRTNSLQDIVLQTSKQYLNNLDSKKWLFPSPPQPEQHLTTRTAQRIINELATRAGITKHVHCHLLRHTVATHLLEDGYDIRVIQKYVGHAKIATTEIYTRVSDKLLKEVKVSAVGDLE